MFRVPFRPRRQHPNRLDANHREALCSPVVPHHVIQHQLTFNNYPKAWLASIDFVKTQVALSRYDIEVRTMSRKDDCGIERVRSVSCVVVVSRTYFWSQRLVDLPEYRCMG